MASKPGETMKNQLTFYIWPVLLGGIAYLSSRGADGDLRLFLIGFSTIGLLYILHNILAKTSISKQHILHLIIFPLFAAVPLFIDPQLEEMGGMLNILIPFGAIIIVLITLVVVLIKNKI